MGMICWWRDNICGVLLLNDELPHSLTTSWLCERKSRNVWSFEVFVFELWSFSSRRIFSLRQTFATTSLCSLEIFSKTWWIYIESIKECHDKITPLSFWWHYYMAPCGFDDKDHHEWFEWGLGCWVNLELWVEKNWILKSKMVAFSLDCAPRHMPLANLWAFPLALG
jgi:hypothetical protein